MEEEKVYYERQRFNQWWIILIMLFVNGIFIYGCFKQLVLGKLWGNNPVDNTMLIVITVLLALITLSFFFIRLETVIDKDGVYERFFPFQLKYRFTPWDYIIDAIVMKNNPIKEFGGWGMRVKLINFGRHGIRYGIGKKAYTISGNYVLQLTLNNNKKIIIGTQKPEELEEFLDNLNAKRNQE